MGKFGEDKGGLEGEGTSSERGSLLPPRSSLSPSNVFPFPPKSLPPAVANQGPKDNSRLKRDTDEEYHPYVVGVVNQKLEIDCRKERPAANRTENDDANREIPLLAEQRQYQHRKRDRPDKRHPDTVRINCR